MQRQELGKGVHAPSPGAHSSKREQKSLEAGGKVGPNPSGAQRADITGNKSIE